MSNEHQMAIQDRRRLVDAEVPYRDGSYVRAWQQHYHAEIGPSGSFGRIETVVAYRYYHWN
jgi:hypothetical protein